MYLDDCLTDEELIQANEEIRVINLISTTAEMIKDSQYFRAHQYEILDSILHG